MIRGYVNQADRLQAVENALERLDAFVWIDLVSFLSQKITFLLYARFGLMVISAVLSYLHFKRCGRL
jgi:hypothetical protein